jgi:phosphonate transport system substrate-binding protein
MRKFFTFTVLLVLALAVAACGGAANPTAAPPTSAPATQPPAPTSAPATTAPTPAATTAATAVPTPHPTLAPPPPAPAAGQLGAPDNPIVMSFVPSGDTTAITTGGGQIADLLKQRTNLTFKVEVGTSYAASIEAMGAGKAQIGWLNTFSYILAHQKYGVQLGLVVTRFGTDYYNGQIIANNNSGIKTMADLKGKKFCYVDPSSTSGYIVPRIVMQANGINPDKDLGATTNAGSHNNVAIAVYKGDCDAGATFVDARSSVQKDFPDIMDKTSVLIVSPNIPNDTVSFVKDFDPAMKTLIVNALLDTTYDPAGKKALNTIYQIGGFVVHDDSFYNDFRGYLEKAGIDPSKLVGS